MGLDIKTPYSLLYHVIYTQPWHNDMEQLHDYCIVLPYLEKLTDLTQVLQKHSFVGLCAHFVIQNTVYVNTNL